MDSCGDLTSAQDGAVNPRSSLDRADLTGLYHLGRTLGRGHFAVVKLGRHISTGQLVAVKMIDKTKLDVMASSHLLQEVRFENRRYYQRNGLRGVESVQSDTFSQKTSTLG